jgi:hypothetical protein
MERGRADGPARRVLVAADDLAAGDVEHLKIVWGLGGAEAEEVAELSVARGRKKAGADTGLTS